MIRKNQNIKYNCIKPENIFVDKEYSFSFNPDEQPLFDRFYKMKLNNLKDWSQKMYDILSTLRHCKVSVTLEVSPKARFHWHGYIRPTSMPEFVINDLPKLRYHGTYEIDVINDEDKWSEYIKKQERFMKNYANKYDMHYEINTIGKVK